MLKTSGNVEFQFYPNREVIATFSRDRAPRKQKKEAREIKLPPSAFPKPSESEEVVLDIASKSSQVKKKRRRSTSLPRKAQVKIRRLTGLFKDSDRKGQVFLTGTLPGSTKQAMQSFSDKTGYVVKLVQTYLSRVTCCQARDLKYLWVWEHQKRGALHMHVCVQTQGQAESRRLMRGWSGLWCRVLKLVDEKSDVDIFERKYGGSWRDFPSKWQTDAQPVKKSAARYMSKYMSKGSHGDGSLAPSRWWGCSSLLRAEFESYVNSNTIELPLKMINNTSREFAEKLLRKNLGLCCDSFATVVSPWYQGSVIRCFSFIPEGKNRMDMVFGVLDGCEQILQKKGNLSMGTFIRSAEEARDKIVRMVYGQAPRYMVDELNISAPAARCGMSAIEYYKTEEGFTHFEMTVKYKTIDHRSAVKGKEMLGDVFRRWFKEYRSYHDVPF